MSYHVFMKEHMCVARIVKFGQKYRNWLLTFTAVVIFTFLTRPIIRMIRDAGRLLMQKYAQSMCPGTLHTNSWFILPNIPIFSLVKVQCRLSSDSQLSSLCLLFLLLLFT